MNLSATQFKARCLALLDEVSETGSEFTITKRGVPVAVVRPVDPDASLVGTVTQLADDDELVAPLGDPWEVD